MRSTRGDARQPRPSLRPRGGSAGRGRLALLLACVASLSCAARYGVNYLDPDGPRCAGRFAPADRPTTAGVASPFTVVSFNVKFGERPDQALGTLRRAGLDAADVLLLQEMDLPSTRRMARELAADYVYYPAAVHPATGRQFGVAVVSRWPIRDDLKLLVPLIRSSDDARKISVLATVWVHGIPVSVASVHLQSGLDPVWLGDQLQLLARCAALGECLTTPGAPRGPARPHVVVAGDFNTRSEAHRAVADEVMGWSRLARVPGIGRTHKLLPGAELDHIYLRNLVVEEAGVVGGLFGTGSDHRPVWARLRADAPLPRAWEGFPEPWLADTAAEADECPVVVR